MKNKIIFTVILLMQLVYLIYCFVGVKSGFHGTEAGYFAYANGEKALLSETVSFDEWIDADIIKNHYEAENGNKFSYRNIIDNCKDVGVAPLYPVVLHTIASVFENFSFAGAFVINMFCFVAVQIMLFLIVTKVTNKEWFSILCCAFYGLSQGGINTYIYIGPYAMATLFTVLQFYILLKWLDKKEVKILISWICVAVLGACNDHYSFVVSATLMILTIICHIMKKEKREILKVLCALIVIFFAGVYFNTSMLKNILVAGANGFWFEFWYLRTYLVYELFGYYIVPLPMGFFILLGKILIGIVLVVPAFAFIFRKDNWYIKFIEKLKTVVKITDDSVKKCLFISVVVVVYICSLSYSGNIFVNDFYSTRFMFAMYPCILFLTLIVFYGICVIIANFIKVFFGVYKYSEIVLNIITCAFAVFLLVFVWFFSAKFYMFMPEDNIKINVEELCNGQNVAVLLDECSVRDFEAVGILLKESENVYYTSSSGVDWDTVMNEKDETVYVLLSDKEDIVKLNKEYGSNEYLGMCKISNMYFYVLKH